MGPFFSCGLSRSVFLHLASQVIALLAPTPTLPVYCSCYDAWCDPRHLPQKFNGNYVHNARL